MFRKPRHLGRMFVFSYVYVFWAAMKQETNRQETKRFGATAALCVDVVAVASVSSINVNAAKPLMENIMEKTVNVYAPVASNLASTAVAFIDANKAADSASTPFARSSLAAIIGGLSSVAMTEALVIAAMGSPKSPSTGKPIKKVSGLRDFDGGARLYQAWKDIVFITENIDADAPKEVVPAVEAEGDTEAVPAVVIGNGAIRSAVVSFILNEGDVKALFGKTGLTAKVKALMAEHAEAELKAHGIEAEGDTEAAEGDTEGKAEGDKPQSLAERVAAMLVALQAADDSAFIDNQTALAALSDYIDSRWDAIADATAPEAEAIAA